MAEDTSKQVDDDEIIQIPDMDEVTEDESNQEEFVEPELNTENLQGEQVKESKNKNASEKSPKKSPKNGKKPNDKSAKSEKQKDDIEEIQNTPEDSAEKSPGKLRKLWQKYLEKKRISIPLTILVVIALLAAIPYTRYTIAGVFVKKTVTISVFDNKTNKPVSEAEVIISGLAVRTDGYGVASVPGVKVGNQTVAVTKKYYQESQANVLVPIRGTASTEFKIQATGRQVPLSITNIVDGKPVKDVLIKSGESSATTDGKGQAVLVLSPDSETEKATITSMGYNNKDVDIKVTDSEDAANKFAITPSGKIYFLSKKSGKIDVVKTNLDGTDRQIVLAGTGNEDEFNTSLLASRDWKYLALHAKRDDKEKMYLIDTSNDQLSTIDEGEATFSPVGWYNDTFVFSVSRTNVQYWQAKQTALKSYNATSKFLKTIDESKAEGASDIDYAAETFGQVYILENELVYAKTWSADYYSGGKIIGKKNTINSVRPDGSELRIVKDFNTAPNGNSYISAVLYKPQEVYFQVTSYTQSDFYEYEGGKIEAKPTVTTDQFNSYYPTFLVSPSSIKTFWYEPRDGKNTLFIGDKNAENEKEITTLSEYQPYGWFTDEYILESKGGSELYIATPSTADKPLKITDYHKPNGSFAGYGYGYGGL